MLARENHSTNLKYWEMVGMLGDTHAQVVRKVSTMQLQKEHTAREYRGGTEA